MFIVTVGALSSNQVFLFSFAILATFFLLFAGFFLSWWMRRKEVSLSPYTGVPLRRATSLSYFSMERVLRFLYQMQQYDNRIFEFKKAAICRETGRIFPNCVTWYDTIKVDWSFIQKHYPGTYVSWGSLTEQQKDYIRRTHDSLDGYQTAFSSPTPSPRQVEPQYAFEKPGPLYVDLQANVLVGWQCVPDTELEVLIVQKPIKIITITPPKE
jgi:hypothetical protein